MDTWTAALQTTATRETAPVSSLDVVAQYGLKNTLMVYVYMSQYYSRPRHTSVPIVELIKTPLATRVSCISSFVCLLLIFIQIV